MCPSICYNKICHLPRLLPLAKSPPPDLHSIITTHHDHQSITAALSFAEGVITAKPVAVVIAS
jgi:hypothetical protein